MAHVRKLIRDNVTTTLTGLSTTGSNVFQTRLFSLGENKLPAICIYTKSEAVEYVTITRPRTQIRTLDVAVEFFVKGTANVDDAIDAVALEIEEALYADPTRGGNAKDTKITDFEADYNSDGEQSVGVGRFTISVDYATLENDIENGV
jgi:hypothetical protein